MMGGMGNGLVCVIMIVVEVLMEVLVVFGRIGCVVYGICGVFVSRTIME